MIVNVDYVHDNFHDGNKDRRTFLNPWCWKSGYICKLYEKRNPWESLCSLVRNFFFYFFKSFGEFYKLSVARNSIKFLKNQNPLDIQCVKHEKRRIKAS